MFSARQRSHDSMGANDRVPPRMLHEASPPNKNRLWNRLATHTENSVAQCKAASGDAAELEADRVAERVLSPTLAHPPEITPEMNNSAPQRMCSECEEEIQRQAGEEANEFDRTSTFKPPACGGQPLPMSLRSYFEPRFNRDFSQVRLHTDRQAADSAAMINARAYTSGHNIVFAEGAYEPRTDSGRHLLAHELTHTIQQGAAGHSRQTDSLHISGASGIQRDRPSRPTRERVWGLPITRSMCGCKDRVREGITWANTAGSTYAACDTPANTTGTDVEACFDAAHPTATTVATTSASGTITLPPPSSDPCQRIDDKATFVHETMHARHTDAIARAQGRAFFREWRKLKGDPDRLDKLRPRFPAQVAAFESQWNNGHDWAQDEVHSYKWERRFLQDALRALNRIC